MKACGTVIGGAGETVSVSESVSGCVGRGACAVRHRGRVTESEKRWRNVLMFVVALAVGTESPDP